MDPENNPRLNSGKRRQTQETKAIRYAFPWPGSPSVRDAMFRDWAYTAKQILNRNGGSFRLLTAMHELFEWETGEVTASDADLAIEAGRCSEKTISREVSHYRGLGIVVTQQGWKWNGSKNVPARIIQLAMPIDMPPYIHLRDLG